MACFWLNADWSGDPKLAKASELARYMWLVGGTFAIRHCTQGFVAEEALRVFWEESSPELYAQELCRAGLWQHVPGGYHIVEFSRWFRPCEEEAVTSVSNKKDRSR